MRLDFLNIVPVSDGKNIVKQLASKYKKEVETLNLLESINRVAAEDVYSTVNLPMFNRSTVDGYAVKCQDVYGASASIPSILTLVATVDMGKTIDIVLEEGQAVYVPTGGMIPEGTEAMVMIEYSEMLDDQTLLIYKPATNGENISYIGDDLSVGTCVVKKGTTLNPYHIGLLVGAGNPRVNVIKKLKVAIISTGDEIMDVDVAIKVGQIRDVNGYALAALIGQYGAEIVYRIIVKDDFESLKEHMSLALEKADVVIMSGGSSVGAKDYTEKLIHSFESGKIHIHGLSIKPGKPTIIGEINNKPIFGLPGHPVSALMVCREMVRTYMRTYYGQLGLDIFVEATLSNNVRGASGRDSYQMVILKQEKEGWIARPFYGKSGIMSVLANSNGYFIIPKEHEGVKQGESIKVYLLKEETI